MRSFFRQGLPGELVSEQDSSRVKSGPYKDNGKDVSGGGNSECKDCEDGMNLECLRINRKFELG